MAEWHLTGPSSMDHPLQGLVSWVYDEAGKSIAVVETDPEYGSDPANALLVAAAPDLLAALEALVPFAMGKIRELSGLPFYGLTGTPDPPEVAAVLSASDFEMARVAIAKATGEEISST